MVAPRDAASRAHFPNKKTIARARIVAGIRVHGVGSDKNAWQWLLELAAIASISKDIRQNGKGRCQKHMVGDLTRLGQRPSELIY